MQKILIAYTSRTGATRTVAETMADVLRDADTQVDILRARKARDISAYQAVIVGTSVYMKMLPREIVRFVRRSRKALRQVPVAYFVTCMAMSEDTEENRRTASSYLDPLRRAASKVEPVDVGLFGGAALTDTPEFESVFPLWKISIKAMAELPDYRDWEAIRAWAEELKPKLLDIAT